MRFTSQLRKSVLVFFLLCAGSYAKDLSDSEAWYAANKKALMALHGLILKHPAIKRVDPGTLLQYVPNHKEFAPETVAAYEEIEKKCVSLGIKNIATAWDDRASGEGLISIRYKLSSSGLAVSGGKSSSLEYIPDEILISNLRQTPENIVTPLDEKNWYVVDYRAGRK